MKALIIENEYEVDGYIKCFLKDNPKLFEKVQEELYCLHRSNEEILPHILKNDAVIVASTWMYKDQLEDFLDAFTNPKFPKKKFFVHWICRKTNEWKHGTISYSDKELFEKIKKLYKMGHEIYEFAEDLDGKKKIMDNLDGYSHRSGRHEYRHWRMKYSEKHDLFYLEGNKHENLKNQLDDEKENLRRASR